jgi:hypothetical protein
MVVYFVMCIRVSVQRNHLFCQTNTQKIVAKLNNLHTEEKPSFVYLRIHISGQKITALQTINQIERLQFSFEEEKLVAP